MPNSREYMREYMKERYQQRREQAVEVLGGACAKCGSTEDMEVDHIDPAKKEMDFARMTMVSEERFLEELKKCQLLCDRCHNTKTAKSRGFKMARGTHGTLSSYRYCKCDECKEAKRKHNREYRLKRKQTLHGAVV